MDGSNAAFLLDLPLASGGSTAPLNGILYIEDFDDVAAARPDTPEPPPPPAYTEADLEDAREAGRQQGLQAALEEASLVQAQLQSACLQSLVDGLQAARAGLETTARAHATELAHTMLAILQAAIPATMRRHAQSELQSLLEALLPGLRCEPELRVRAHPALADFVRDSLMGGLPAESCALSVRADASLAPGDVEIGWQDGHARRDCAAIWAAVTAALAPLDLPNCKDICHGD